MIKKENVLTKKLNKLKYDRNIMNISFVKKMMTNDKPKDLKPLDSSGLFIYHQMNSFQDNIIINNISSNY